MNINAYLPDALGRQAKDAQLPFSELLQLAVKHALDRRAELEAAKNGMVPQEVEAQNREGNPLLLRFHGKRVGGDPEAEVYLTESGRVIVVFEEEYVTFDDVAAFSEWVAEPMRNNLGGGVEAALREAVGALGGRLVVEID